MPSVHMTTEELELLQSLVREGIWQLDYNHDAELQAALKLSGKAADRDKAVDHLDRISVKLRAAHYQSIFAVGG